MSYNILNKNVNFQGVTQGTIEDLVDTHSDQSITGSKDFLSLTGSYAYVKNRISVNTTSTQYHVTVIGSVSASTHGFFGGTVSGSEFYGGGSNLTGLPVTALNSATANELVTVGSTTTELDAEALLTFDSSNRRLTVGGTEDETQWGSIIVHGGQISGSGNISGSTFYGSGAGLTGIPASAVSLAANSGLNNSSGLIVDVNNATTENSADGTDFLLIYDGSGLKKITCQKVANLSSPADWCGNMTNDRIVTSAGSDTMNAEANLTFNGDSNLLTLAGNMSGSGYVSASAFVATGGNIIATGEGNLIANGITVDTSLGLAGQGLWNNSGKLDIQTSGSIHTALLSGPRYHLGITGSIANNGLEYAGGVNSISGLAVKLDSNSGLAVGSDGLKTSFAALASATPAVASDNLTFIDSDGDKKCSFTTFLTAIAGANLGVSGSQLTASAADVDIDGLSALGGTGLHQTQDHFMFSDNGTEKKITFSNLEDAIFANVSGDATIAAGGALTIASNAVQTGMVHDDVATELAGDGLVASSGVLAVQVSGAVKIASDKLGLTGSIAGSGLGYSGGVNSISALALDIDELSALGGTGLHQTQDHFVFSDNGTEKKITFSNLEDAIFANVSGDATIAAGGALTIAANAVQTGMVHDDVATELAGDGLVASSGVMAVQVSGAAVVVSDKVGISGSIAGTGLDYSGGVNSISAINVDLTDVGFGGGANRIVTDDGDGTVTTEANLTFDGSVLTVAGAISGSGNISGSAFYGDGSNLTGISAGAVSAVANGVDNRIATFSSSDALNGEANLTFDGDTLTVTCSEVTAIPAVTIDRNYIGTTSIGNYTTDPQGLLIDYDITGIVASGSTSIHDAIAINFNQDSPTHSGSLNSTGIDCRMVGGTSGTQTMKGVAIHLAGANTNTGIDITVPNDGTHFVARSPDSLLDQFKISVGAAGATTLSTNDNDAAVAHLTFNVDGDIILNPVGGNVRLTGSVLTLDSSNDAKIFDSTVGASGSVVALKYKEVAHTCGTDNDNDEVANFFTSGMIPFALGIRVTSAIGNNAYVTKIGTMNDDDSFGTFGDGDVEESGDNLVTSYHPANATGQNTKWFTSNHELRITYNATPSSGALRLGLYYYDITPPTS